MLNSPFCRDPHQRSPSVGSCGKEAQINQTKYFVPLPGCTADALGSGICSQVVTVAQELLIYLNVLSNLVRFNSSVNYFTSPVAVSELL